MKQLIQNISSSESKIEEAPIPKTEIGRVFVKAKSSHIFAGTERMVVDFVRKNLLQKAKSRAELVKQTFENIKRDGFLTTIQTIRMLCEIDCFDDLF